MNEVLIVPDIHGRNFWEPALDYQGEVIFLGDYTDPYPHEGFTEEDAYQSLLKIIDFKRQHPDRVTLLIGNHELHYYNPEFQSSRFSVAYFEKYHELLTSKKNKDLFQICKQKDNYLFIHAGITKGWCELHRAKLQKHGNTLEKQLNGLFRRNMKVFFEVSKMRCGADPYGSPLWADIEEHYLEEEHFDNDIIQIIGHTQLQGNEPFEFKNIRLLDNRQLYILKDNEIKHWSIFTSAT